MSGPAPLAVLTWLAGAAFACALVPAVVFLRNLRRFQAPAPAAGTRPAGPLSVLIPARDEERSIGAALAALLASRGVDLEVVVLDDGSTDRTAAIVEGLAAADPRVRLERAPPLPPGWCGKQHACAVLAGLARHPVLVFVDADVRLAPDGLARAAAFLADSGADLVSGFPEQETGTWLERLLVPLIHFVLLGFLPLGRMRRTTDPAYGAGCGQWMIARRDAYDRSGGHAGIRASLHDGVKLPRLFRRGGFATDLFDATGLAVCRMYRSAGEVWRGLGKNASEGLGAPATIVPATALLALGQVLPLPLVAAGVAGLLTAAGLALAVAAAVAAYLPRLIAVRRFRQPLAGALLHPLGVALLLAVQWQALARRIAGRPAAWKGRSYAAAGMADAGPRPPADG